MSLTVAYCALATGVIVWAILVSKLRVRPWEAQPAAAIEDAGMAAVQPKRIGLWIFLAVITSLFCLFISAYYMRMGAHGGHGVSTAPGDWTAIRDPTILWFNTIVLILSSVAMQSARAAVTRGLPEQTKSRLLAAGALTFAFLIGQFLAWRELRASEAFTPANPAVAFFYVLTAVHGIHLLGGLFVWARTIKRALRKDTEIIDVRLSVELTTVYWHYLLLVWLGLFAVLLST